MTPKPQYENPNDKEPYYKRKPEFVVTVMILLASFVGQWYLNSQTLEKVEANQERILQWKEYHTLNDQRHVLENVVDLSNLAEEIMLVTGKRIEIITESPRSPNGTARRAQ